MEVKRNDNDGKCTSFPCKTKSFIMEVITWDLVLGIICCFFMLAALLVSTWVTICIALASFLFLQNGNILTTVLPEKANYYRDKVIWITGGSSGIGLSLAKAVCIRKCHLIISGRSITALERAKNEILSFALENGINVPAQDIFLLPFDLPKSDELAGVFKQAIDWKGRIDILFNNAGISARGMLLPHETVAAVINVDLLAQMHLTKLLVNHVSNMKKENEGSYKHCHVVFTNSVQGRFTLAGKEAYAVAKAGLLVFAHSMKRDCIAKDLNMSFSSIMAGYTQTNLAANTAGHNGIPLPGFKLMHETHKKGMHPDTLAYYALKGVSNGLEEIWIAHQPVLAFLYIAYYAPFISDIVTLLLAKKYGNQSEQESKMFAEIRDSCARKEN